jgi:hypothetical protein
MSLKLNGLADSTMAPATKKIPPQNAGERSRNVIENARRRNIGFLALHDVIEKQ